MTPDVPKPSYSPRQAWTNLRSAEFGPWAFIFAIVAFIFVFFALSTVRWASEPCAEELGALLIHDPSRQKALAAVTTILWTYAVLVVPRVVPATRDAMVLRVAAFILYPGLVLTVFEDLGRIESPVEPTLLALAAGYILFQQFLSLKRYGRLVTEVERAHDRVAQAQEDVRNRLQEITGMQEEVERLHVMVQSEQESVSKIQEEVCGIHERVEKQERDLIDKAEQTGSKLIEAIKGIWNRKTPS